MTATVIYGTDFKRSNPKADRAFWIGAEKATSSADPGPCEAAVYADTAPCEYVAPPDGDCA